MKKYFIIALMSQTLISLEVVWTRIFSAEFFYTFAFLILSLAILGLGLGALSLRLFAFLNRKNIVGILLTASTFIALIGPIIVTQIGLDFSKLFNSFIVIAKLIFTLFLLGAPFFFGGIALAKLFKTTHQNISRLYMADLLGAGSGVLLSILLMNLWGTPITTVIVCLPMLLAALLASEKWYRIVPILLAPVLIVIGYQANTLLEIPDRDVTAGIPTYPPVIYKHWDAMAKIEIYDFGPQYRVIEIDNIARSWVYAFDGNWIRQAGQPFDFELNIKYLVQQFDSCTFLSLGAGGGRDVLQALQEGATEIHAVEVNPHINKLMLEGELADFSGNIYKDPRVNVITEDARAYVRRFRNKFDIIFSSNSNTFAALASGSFALSENYLYTTEAFQDYYQALTDSGFMIMEHQFYMPKIVSEVLDALNQLGIKKPASHIAVYNLPKLRTNVIILSKRSLTENLRYHALGDLTPQKHHDIHLIYPTADSSTDNLIKRIIEKGWRTVKEEAPIDITPSNDNRPFTAQLGLWKNLDLFKLKDIKPYEFYGFPISKLIIAIILLIIFILIIPLNLLPYALKGGKLHVYPWLYFFLIGIGFMTVEVVLIQRYTLFIGPSSYSLSTILVILLISSGIGSRFAGKFNDKIPFIGIIIWLLIEIFLLRRVTYLLYRLDMLSRILVTVICIFPVGFFMGMPFPKGGHRVKELIDWGFAVNGAASVLGSTAIVLISFNYGFNVALMISSITYLLAFLLLQVRKLW